jgi:hypothetical protein
MLRIGQLGPKKSVSQTLFFDSGPGKLDQSAYQQRELVAPDVLVLHKTICAPLVGRYDKNNTDRKKRKITISFVEAERTMPNRPDA